MWEQYKKTFLGVQALALIVAAFAYLTKGHHLSLAAMVFFVMQASAFVGAAWSDRLRRKTLRGAQ